MRMSGARRKYTIKDCEAVALSHGGKCLSTKFTKVIDKMQWCCAEGHMWETQFRVVNDGHWCPECAKIKNTGAHFKLSIEHAKKTAEERGGQCLSTEYKNQKTHLRWKCGNPDHSEWPASYDSVLNGGHWCPACGEEKWLARVESRRLPDGLELAQRIAHEHGGKCLSTQYVNIQALMEWECEDSHRWENSLTKVKDRGQWCPECMGWKRERECREILERLLGEKFPGRTPSWFGGKERLDGYNAKLGLAFEHNGEQHYHYVPYFHRNRPEDLAKQQARDKRVEYLCDDNWTTLIVIPYWVKDIESFIRKELRILAYI